MLLNVCTKKTSLPVGREFQRNYSKDLPIGRELPNNAEKDI
jgi:hypothetical protein